MACGMPILVSNKTVEAIIREEDRSDLIFKEGDVGDLAMKLVNYFKTLNNEKKNLGCLMRQLVLEQHSLPQLINKLITFVSS